MPESGYSDNRIVNGMSVDVEDYFQVSAMAPYISRDSWDSIACRVERNVDQLLKLFDERGSRSTFFMLGWVAERYPQVTRRIVAAGHELASHGYGHMRATDQKPRKFWKTLVA
jgi:polysaccharide deacetylase family protein (PEP-CTERM system associated)